MTIRNPATDAIKKVRRFLAEPLFSRHTDLLLKSRQMAHMNLRNQMVSYSYVCSVRLYSLKNKEIKYLQVITKSTDTISSTERFCKAKPQSLYSF